MLASGPAGPGILDVCRDRGVKVLEDAAHAFPTRCGTAGRHPGRRDLLSFYANKTITTGEGGMLTTDDPDIAARAKVMRLHGIDRDVWDRFTAGDPRGNTTSSRPATSTTCPTSTRRSAWPARAHIRAMRDRRGSSPGVTSSASPGWTAIDLPHGARAPEDHAWHLFVSWSSRVPASTDTAGECLADVGSVPRLLTSLCTE